jgi:biotin operon repressor
MISARDTADLIELWREGQPACNIAWVLGCGESAVYKRVKALRNKGENLPPHHALPTISAQDTADLIELWREGQPACNIAWVLGCSESAVYKRVEALRNKGEKLPKRRIHRPRKRRNKRVGSKRPRR